MVDLPTFTDAKETVEDAARQHGRNLIPWLPTPPECRECSSLLYADVTWDPRMVEYVNSWTCRNQDCTAPDVYRDDPGAPDPTPPSRGANELRKLLQ